MRLRSPYSNPIDSAINTGMNVMSILDAIEDRPVKRRLMEAEAAHKIGQMQQEEKERPVKFGMLQNQAALLQNQTAQQQKDIEWTNTQRSKAESEQYEKEILRDLQTVDYKQRNKIDLDDRDNQTVMLADHAFKQNLAPDQYVSLGKMMTGMKTQYQQLKPLMQSCMAKGQACTISDKSYPDIINGLNMTPGIGDAVNKGLDKYGQTPMQKKIKSIVSDTKGNLHFIAEVTTKNPQTGMIETYEAPLTVGRNADKKAAILQMPFQLLEAKIDATDNFVNGKVLPMIMKYGGENYVKERQKTIDGMKQMQAFAAGEEAMKTAGGKIGDAKSENAFRTAALEKAKELGIAVSAKDIAEYMKMVKPDKEEKAPAVHKMSVGQNAQQDMMWDAEKGQYVPVPGTRPSEIHKPGRGGGGADGEDGEDRLKGYESTGIDKQVGVAFLDKALENITDEDIKSKVSASNAVNYLTKEQRLIYRGVTNEAKKIKNKNPKMPDSEAVNQALIKYQNGTAGDAQKPARKSQGASQTTPKDGEVRTGPDGIKYRWNSKTNKWQKNVRTKMNVDKFSNIMGANTGGM